MDKLLTLSEWDSLTFNKPHSIRTLRNWAKTGQIQPQPVKIGREYLVEPGAKHVKLVYPETDLSDRARAILHAA